MLNLIYGVSGAGKTAFLIDRIRADIQSGRRCFLLVPEQQAYISERDFLAVLPQNAGLYFTVANFSSLAEAVFAKYGGVTKGTVNKGLRTLLMWDTLRTLSPVLTQYSKSAGKDLTLPQMMLQAVEELRSNGIDPELLEQTAEKLPHDTPLYKKLKDLSAIGAVFHERCESCLGDDPSDKLLRMAKQLQENDYFGDCNIYVDSFTSFTAQEYAVLREILRQAASVSVSLCTDSLFSTLPHFETTVKTAKRLRDLAACFDLPVRQREIRAKAYGKPHTLRILERDLWRFDLTRSMRVTPPEEEADVIRMTVCSNLYEEAEAAALNILDCVRNGMCFGDIAVVVRDTEVYRGVLDAALERYGIPYFLSERTDLSVKPLTRLILSALRAVGHYYQAQDVMTLVKTGLAGISLSDAAMFEEYCETWHINGSRFTDSVWSMNPDGLTTERSARADAILDAANRSRTTVMEPLLRFAAEMRQSARLTDRCRALYHYLCELRISEQLSARAAAELKSGAVREAGETLRLYRFITDTLAQLCALMPDAEVTVDEFFLALSILFSETDLGSVPNLHDCVMIGSASTLRVENVKASLLLGLCEGEFPRAVSDDGLLSEGDKAVLEDYGILLDSREATRSSEELLYVYRAMTKPSERIFLSTVAQQIDGSQRTPSLAFSRVAFLFDKTPEIFDMDALHAKLGTSQLQPKAELCAPSMGSGVTLRLSQTRLQTFMLCPYRYYSTYRLKTREKKDSKPSYADDGVFLHYIFEHFLRSALQKDGSLLLPTHEAVDQIADRIIEDYLMSVCPVLPEHMDKHLLHLFARLRKLATVMLHDMINELKSSRFVPTFFEKIIGGEGGLPPVVLDMKDGCRILLSGKIDRIDLYESNDKIYVRVVDYKSGSHSFRLEDVRSGLDIQLILYLFAVLSSDPARYAPGGAQYLYTANDKGRILVERSGFLISEDEVLTASDNSDGRDFTKKLLLQTAEEIADLSREMNQAIISAGERILAGEANKTPSKEACLFCPVRNCCDKAYHE